MRKLIALICIILGVLCLCVAVGLVFYNQLEAEKAAENSRLLLDEMKSIINENKSEISSQDQNSDLGINENNGIFKDEVNNISKEMLTTEVAGYECIGILSIPNLNLELPVLTDWSYAKLKIAPCHYFGSYYGKDFVIAAHNYTLHFGRLSLLQPGDRVIFTDASGTAHYYEVILLETLPENATNEMITSGFDLSLYTCTLGGDSRVTVRCNAVCNN